MADELEALKARWEQHRNPSHVAECAAGDALLAALERLTAEREADTSMMLGYVRQRDEARVRAEMERDARFDWAQRNGIGGPTLDQFRARHALPWERPTEGA